MFNPCQPCCITLPHIIWCSATDLFGAFALDLNTGTIMDSVDPSVFPNFQNGRGCCWVGDYIYFTSAEDDTHAIYSYNTKTKATGIQFFAPWPVSTITFDGKFVYLTPYPDTVVRGQPGEIQLLWAGFTSQGVMRWAVSGLHHFADGLCVPYSPKFKKNIVVRNLGDGGYDGWNNADAADDGGQFQGYWAYGTLGGAIQSPFFSPGLIDPSPFNDDHLQYTGIDCDGSAFYVSRGDRIETYSLSGVLLNTTLIADFDGTQTSVEDISVQHPVTGW